MFLFLFCTGSYENYPVRVEGAEIEFYKEILLPEVSDRYVKLRVTERSVTELESVGFVRVTSHLNEQHTFIGGGWLQKEGGLLSKNILIFEKLSKLQIVEAC